MKAGRKMRWSLGAAVMAMAATLGTATVSTAWADDAPTSSPGTAIAIMQAAAAIDNRDCAAARAPLNLLWNDPYLDQSDPKLAAQMRASLIGCVAQAEGMKAAIALSADNIKRPTSRIEAHDLHVFLLTLDQQVPAAVRALTEALNRFPDTAHELTDLSVLGVYLQIHDADPVAAQTLLNRIQDVGWQAHNPAMRPLIGLMRVEGLRRALAAGDEAHSMLYRQDIARDSLIYVLSQGDGELSDPAMPPMDVTPVMAMEILDTQSYVVNSPSELVALSYLMMLERANGQNNLALTQLDGILALVDKYGLQNFQNMESYPGLLTVKASLLADLGRPAEADAAFKAGIAKLTPEAGVGHTLAYVNYLIDSGRETEALALSASLSPDLLDDSQKLQQMSHSACAYAYQGDEPRYAQMMSALQSQPLLRVKPSLCAGDSEGAAQAVIAATLDPGNRLDTIMFLQNGLAPIAYGPRDKRYVEALLALKMRPDVIAAAKAARINIRTWPLRF